MRASSVRGDITRTRAAASSMASGRPSSSLTSCGIAARSSAPGWKSRWPTRRAHEQRLARRPRPAAPAPAPPRPAGPAPRAWSRGSAPRRRGRASGPSVSSAWRATCSKLSRITRQRPRPAMAWPSCTHRIVLAQRHVQALRHGVRRCRRRRAPATGRRTRRRPGSRRARSRRSAVASRVLPVPPMPSTDTSRAPASKRRASSASASLAADEGVALGRQAVAHLAQRQPQVATLHDAVDLAPIRRRREGRVVVAGLEQLHRLGDALDAPVAVRLHAQRRSRPAPHAPRR